MSCSCSRTDGRCTCGCGRNGVGATAMASPGLTREVGTPERRTSAYVAWLQESLNRVTGAGLVVDGVSGRRTSAALRAFQSRAGLTVDGVTGPATERALVARGAPPPPGAGRLPAPSPTPAPSIPGGSRSCPAPSSITTDSCVNPMTCPAIPDLLCVNGVGNVPFDYPQVVARDRATGLAVVTRRLQGVTQRFVATTGGALGRFVGEMSQAGLPIETILTAGSYYCRCKRIGGRATTGLSNHSFGDAIDVVGVHWSPPGPRGARLRETIVHNFADPGDRVLLRRINACLRLAFATVIDYHRADHRDHFHCDMNRGRGRNPLGRETVPFVKECLNAIVGTRFPEDAVFDAAAARALAGLVSLTPQAFTDRGALNTALDQLFRAVAAGR
jgi:hypothetical protein